MRKVMRKPATAHAKQLAIKKLSEFRRRGQDPGKILELATLNNWTGLWSDKNGETENKNYIGGI